MSTANKRKAENGERLKRNVEKWSAPLMDAGWTVVPSVILERQKALHLDPIDMNILMQLARYWWYADRPPHPGKKAIAECIGVNESTVRKRIARMESQGLITREARYDAKHGGQQTNVYRFTGLIKTAVPFAREAVAERENRVREADDRIRRRRPKLMVVKPTGTIGQAE